MGPVVLHSSVVDTLGCEITTGALAPGSVLTLAIIGARFGVSRTVAREAMRLLESLQLVTSQRRIGLVVRPAADWDVYDPRVVRWRLTGPERDTQLGSLSALRAAVEPAAAAAAARSASRDECSRIRELAQMLRAAGDEGNLEDFCQADIAFHALVLRASGNEMFAALTDVVTAVLSGQVHLGDVPAAMQPASIDAHDAIARAICSGDTLAAEEAMAALMGHVHASHAPESAVPVPVPEPLEPEPLEPEPIVPEALVV